MTKRLFFMLGVIVGLLFAVIGYRKRMEHLKVLEEKEAHHRWLNAEADKRWQKEVEKMTFEERMDWELFEASLKSYNYQPPWGNDDEDDES
jgi:hypothetical protein